MASEDESPAGADSSPYPQWNSDFDGINLGPVCHIQRAESRFGSHVTEDIRHFVFEDAGGGTLPMNADDDDEEEELEEEEEEDDADEATDQTTNPGLQTHSEEAQPSELSSGNHPQPNFPKMARLRCNLTSMSQRYNLYFAAYQDKIYVYQPKAPPEILPGPSLILHPKCTKAARLFGGVIDRMFPHQINNMVVGNLGNLEALLFVYDDGDVGAYYTHTIVRAILANDEQRQGLGIPGARHVIPKQFFSENVGMSAWGVAIHEKSRLLAVSSNKHEVTVFALALNGQPDYSKPRNEVDRSPKTWSGQTAMELERHFRSRTRTWRVILPVGPQGHNIPTIAFLEDEKGEALKVVALDINENTWILDIWRIGSRPLLIPGAASRGLIAPQRIIGWGVLVLPDSSFMHVDSVHEAVGVLADQIIDRQVDNSRPRGSNPDRRSHTWLDTTCSLYNVKDMAADPAIFLQNRFGSTYSHIHSRVWRPSAGASAIIDDEPLYEEMENDTDTQPSDAESAESEQQKSYGSEGETKDDQSLSDGWRVLSKFPGPRTAQLDDLKSETQLARVIIPSFGETPHFDGSTSNYVHMATVSHSLKGRSEAVFFAEAPDESLKGLSILRATATDIELVSLNPSFASVQCKCVITYHNHHRRRQEPYDLTRNISERISMLVHVPELNLVVAGAMTGRVALISLTKTKATVRGWPLRRGFRVDHILPRKSEEDKRLRPWCTLHGIAVSPVPDARTRGLQLETGRIRSGPPPSLRHRLILHYLDHTILMYYIERKGEELLIF